MNRSRIVPIFCLLATAMFWAGCESEIGYSYPVEKAPADFPGLEYTLHEGRIPLLSEDGSPVWIVGVDGASWSIIQPMIDRGELPNFAGLVERGAHGTLVSEEPTISPALWATVATGVPRFVHGVENFLVKLPRSYDVDEAGPLDRRSPALWDFVGVAEGTSAVISWFGSYPAEQIPGTYISKGFDPSMLRSRQVHPAPFISKLARDGDVRLREEDVRDIARNESLRQSLVADARTMAALRTVVADRSHDLTVVYFSGIDVAQHLTWGEMDPMSRAFPAESDTDGDLAGVIPAYYRFIDRALGEIRALAPDDATLIVLSDHGAGPMGLEEAFHFQLEVLLETLGLMDGQRGLAFAIDELYRHDKRIWLNLAGIEPMGTVALDEADDRAGSIEERLSALRTDDGSPVFESIVRHTALPGWLPGEPALTVRFSSSALPTSAVHEGGRSHDFAPVRLRHTDVTGSHRPEGILIFEGPLIRPGELDHTANLYQIAPTVMYLIGLPQDRQMLRFAPEDGGVLEAALSADVLAKRPIAMVEGYPGTDRSMLLRSLDNPDDPDDPAREQSLEKLRSLGYIR